MSSGARFLLIGAIPVVCSFSANVSAIEDDWDRLLGRMIYADTGGVGAGTAYVSVGVEVKGRNLVELHFGKMLVYWTSESLTLFNENREITYTFSIMLNCKSRRYSPYPGDDRSQASERNYNSGSMYDWTDFSSEEVIIGNKTSMEKMYALFSDACTLTDI